MSKKIFQISVAYNIPTSEIITLVADNADAAIDAVMNSASQYRDVEIHQIEELVDNTPPDFSAQKPPQGKPQLRIVN